MSVDGRKAKVDFNGNIVDVNVGVVSVSPGDYVLVHAGCAIEAMDEAQADVIISAFSEVMLFGDEDA
jgi:hydrogenase expression/formation protein HypC